MIGNALLGFGVTNRCALKGRGFSRAVEAGFSEGYGL